MFLSAREIWEIELDVLIVCPHIPDTFEATTPDMVTPALQNSLEHQSAEGKK